MRNDGAKGRDAASWSLTNRGQYIDTDSQRSPYGDRKYPVLPQSPERERVQNIDREKQTIVSSRDLHESFVEPVEWFDDFDKDARVRLARGLKTVDTDALVARPESGTTKYERSLVNGSIDRVRKIENGTSLETEDSPALVRYSPSSLDVTRLSDSRVKREIASPYDTYYEDRDRYNRDYEETDDDDEDDLQFLNSYEDVDKENGQGLLSEENLERYDYLEDDYGDDYEDVVENVDLKRKEPRIGKKHRKKATKKRKKKNHVDKSSENHEKRRHRKKHSNDSKTKDRKSHKREKSASKSGSRRNVKKSKVTQNEGENRSEEGGNRGDVEEEDVSKSLQFNKI